MRMKPDVFIAQCKPTYDQIPLPPDAAIRRSLQSIWRLMGRDPENPFQEDLRNGDTAVIKPNWVMDANNSGGGVECLITHSSLIACVMEWCAKAMNGKGRVIVGDCPIQGCDFDALLQVSGMHEILRSFRQSYPNVDVRVADWRLTVFAHRKRTKTGMACGHEILHDQEANVSKHYTILDAGDQSFLEEIVEYADRFRVTMYPPSLLQSHHCQGQHQYLIRNEVLDADLLVNLPKMKTHQKAGLTGALKNLVGVNGHKEYLPHHIRGSYFSGGDSYCSDNRFAAWADSVYDAWWERYSNLNHLQRWLFGKTYTLLKAASRLTGGDRIAPGSWSGNETIWRTILDLNHLLYFGPRKPKQVLNLVDGIIAGEGEGPLRPTPKPCGLILVGENPAFVDAAIAKLMGYTVARVPTVYHAVYHRKSKFGTQFPETATVHLVNENGESRNLLCRDLQSLGFTPPANWRRAIRPSGLSSQEQK